MRILPQAFQRLLLELVEGMRRAVLEEIIREKAELRVAIVSVDQVAELEREGGRNRNGAGGLPRNWGARVCSRRGRARGRPRCWRNSFGCCRSSTTARRPVRSARVPTGCAGRARPRPAVRPGPAARG